MTINRFDGQHKFLSNFAQTPIAVKIDGQTVIFPTAEHLYQSLKTIDNRIRAKFATIPSPGGAKKAGSKLALRDDWEQIKVEAMKWVISKKFWATRNKEGAIRLAETTKQLLDTGDQHLEEGNYWGDEFWGVCGGTGQNMLGKLLMERRQTVKDALSV